MKAVRRKVPLYGSRVWLVFDEEGWDQARRQVRTPPGEEPLGPWSEQEGVASTYDCTTKHGQEIILRFDTHEHDHRGGMGGIIAHEIFHATTDVCSHAGIFINAHSDEPAAYIAQWFGDLVFQHLPDGVKL